MSFLRTFSIALVLAGCSHDAAMPPPAPPLPWLVDAYIGFERAADMDSIGSSDTWYHQNALQIRGDEIQLRKTTVICSGGRIYSSEGDGGSLLYSGRITTGESGKFARLSFVSCDGCIGPHPGTAAFGTFELPISVLTPRSIRLGDVMYSKDQAPYPNRCPRAGV
jgi:hypothetical protein